MTSEHGCFFRRKKQPGGVAALCVGKYRWPAIKPTPVPGVRSLKRDRTDKTIAAVETTGAWISPCLPCAMTSLASASVAVPPPESAVLKIGAESAELPFLDQNEVLLFAEPEYMGRYARLLKTPRLDRIKKCSCSRRVVSFCMTTRQRVRMISKSITWLLLQKATPF